MQRAKKQREWAIQTVLYGSVDPRDSREVEEGPVGKKPDHSPPEQRIPGPRSSVDFPGGVR
ncbi:hypothetical protein [Paludifilum halophilum]|uniref:Uncharacterized protein n=1 Tax=Paludifilum halophilum TaxID=1642702 RepID=A0A235BBC2_9BACL|nr:hypothetical protein [Paludifilum halophilum]OYD08865.1 hypothetical protein CHM34_03520 [Paludifilum halophilum]